MFKTTAAGALAALALGLSAAVPAHADATTVVPATGFAHFSGHCWNWSVTYGLEPTSPGETAAPEAVGVFDPNLLTSKVLQAGQSRTYSSSFRFDHRAKTVWVYHNTVPVAHHTYWCGSRR